MKFRNLDLNLLRVFDEVMATRNITRAAENLAMTQPAVSNALRRLREALGDDLVLRSGHGIEPTPRALALWPVVSAALDSLRDELESRGFDPAQSDGSFQLAMADATAAMLMPALVRRIEQQAPRVVLRVLPLTTRDPRRLLEAGEVDLAIGYFPGAVAAISMHSMQSGLPDAFDHQRLYRGRYVCVMRRAHPLSPLQRSAPLSIDEFCAANHLLVSFSGRAFGFIDEALAEIGRKRHVMLTVNQFSTAGRVVVGSDLLTILPHHFIESTGIADQLAWVELPFQVPPVNVDMVWHRRTQQERAQQWLRGVVAEAAGEVFPDR